MTSDVLSALLEAELDAGTLLLNALDRQREALVARDLEAMDDLTAALEDRMAQFSALVQTRIESLASRPDLTDHHRALVQRARHTEARLLRLAQLNHDLIADRLACVGAMLATLGLTTEAGYAPAGGCSRPVVRSA